MRAALYARVSTKEQDAATQLSDITTSYPEAKSADVVIEEQSAWKDHLKVRPKFKVLKEKISKREYAALYIWDLDRLYRNQKAAVSFLQYCDFYGCRVYSHRQKFLNDFEGIPEPWGTMVKDMLVKVLAWVAEDESNRRSDRIKKAVVREGGVTLSYKGGKWGRPEVVLDLDRVRELTAAGKSCRGIARELGVSKTKVAGVLKLLTKSLKAESAITKPSVKGSI
jgi:DNA invertase Pin-like site-specific DNA recombinase